MKFEDYIKLKTEAKEAGINSPALKQLIHIMQAKDIAVKHHNMYMREMNAWEKNIAIDVKQQIKEACSVKAGEQE